MSYTYKMIAYYEDKDSAVEVYESQHYARLWAEKELKLGAEYVEMWKHHNETGEEEWMDTFILRNKTDYHMTSAMEPVQHVEVEETKVNDWSPNYWWQKEQGGMN